MGSILVATVVKFVETTVEFVQRSARGFTGGFESDEERAQLVDESRQSQSPYPVRPSAMGQLDVARNELSRTRKELKALTERYTNLEKTLRESQDLVKSKDQEIERLAAENREHRRRSTQSHASSSRRHVTPPSLRTAASASRIPSGGSLSSYEERHSHHHHQRRPHSRTSTSSTTSSSLDEADARLASLDTFLSKIDRWSGAQVIQSVNDLNSETLQVAALIAETLQLTHGPGGHPSSKLVQAAHDTSARLGSHLTRLLSTQDHTQDPILVQLALQACVSTCIARSMTPFCSGLHSKSDVVLSGLYAHIYASEPQPTSSRWRSLTHRYIHQLHPNLDKYAEDELVETIFRWSSDIFLVAGCTSPEPNTSIREGLRTRFGAQVHRIAKAACKLAQVTREEIMSANFELIAVEHGNSFDPVSMLDAFEDYGATRGAILCTTELGLRCSTRKTAVELGLTEGDGTIERRLLLRPKVLLESVTDTISSA